MTQVKTDKVTSWRRGPQVDQEKASRFKRHSTNRKDRNGELWLTKQKMGWFNVHYLITWKNQINV